MNKKNLLLGMSAIALAIVMAFGSRERKKRSTPSALYFANGGICNQLLVLCDGSTVLFTGITAQSMTITSQSGDAKFYIYATSNCIQKVVFSP